MVNPKPHDKPKPKRCGAKTRYDDKRPCRRWAMPNGRCYMHGGRAKHGFDSPAFKTGKYSKYLPKNLLESYANAINDPDLLSNRESVAIIEMRLVELLGDLNVGNSAELWGKLIDEWAKFISAIQRDNKTQQSQSINRLNRIMNDGSAIAATWREIYDNRERFRRLVETEQRVATTRETMVSIESVLMYLTIQIEATKSAVKKYVDDQETQSKIIDAAADANRELLGQPVDR